MRSQPTGTGIEPGAGGPRPGAAGKVGVAEALRETWLELWYQPIIDLRRKCLAGAEALARIRHPQLGVLLPGRFLPGLDDDGHVDLAVYAIASALEDWAVFRAAGFNLRLAVNIPVHVLGRVPIADLMAEHRPDGADWPGLTVEIPEDQIVRDIAQAQAVAAALQATGIALSIDDFGAGYVSPSTLRDLSFAALKLNHSFVKDCATDATNAAICQTAVDLAHRFGSVAVAEGIESLADLQALQIMGCDFGQGVLLAPPMPKDRFLALLRQRVARSPSSAAPSSAAPSRPAAGAG
ncbi:Phytochrome-like protein cph2 [Rhodoplanes serenus]|uniref:Phytochrome-like protein cph2 n=1 Tax=Rhodoplanes serenus TaxID=200615 RepID=A0A3S4BTJ5_9BRAD|nr:EAL domain-containing protein [Rhodoplanes serenus]VCU07005.1 Phytochrome-like protein cph2 [Rhodoplanes serenus]